MASSQATNISQLLESKTSELEQILRSIRYDLVVLSNYYTHKTRTILSAGDPIAGGVEIGLDKVIRSFRRIQEDIRTSCYFEEHEDEEIDDDRKMQLDEREKGREEQREITRLKREEEKRKEQKRSRSTEVVITTKAEVHTNNIRNDNEEDVLQDGVNDKKYINNENYSSRDRIQHARLTADSDKSKEKCGNHGKHSNSTDRRSPIRMPLPAANCKQQQIKMTPSNQSNGINVKDNRHKIPSGQFTKVENIGNSYKPNSSRDNTINQYVKGSDSLKNSMTPPRLNIRPNSARDNTINQYVEGSGSWKNSVMPPMLNIRRSVSDNDIHVYESFYDYQYQLQPANPSTLGDYDQYQEDDSYDHVEKFTQQHEHQGIYERLTPPQADGFNNLNRTPNISGDLPSQTFLKQIHADNNILTTSMYGLNSDSNNADVAQPSSNDVDDDNEDEVDESGDTTLDDQETELKRPYTEKSDSGSGRSSDADPLSQDINQDQRSDETKNDNSSNGRDKANIDAVNRNENKKQDKPIGDKNVVGSDQTQENSGAGSKAERLKGRHQDPKELRQSVSEPDRIGSKMEKRSVEKSKSYEGDRKTKVDVKPDLSDRRKSSNPRIDTAQDERCSSLKHVCDEKETVARLGRSVKAESSSTSKSVRNTEETFVKEVFTSGKARDSSAIGKKNDDENTPVKQVYTSSETDKIGKKNGDEEETPLKEAHTSSKTETIPKRVIQKKKAAAYSLPLGVIDPAYPVSVIFHGILSTSTQITTRTSSIYFDRVYDVHKIYNNGTITTPHVGFFKFHLNVEASYPRDRKREAKSSCKVRVTMETCKFPDNLYNWALCERKQSDWSRPASGITANEQTVMMGKGERVRVEAVSTSGSWVVHRSGINLFILYKEIETA